MRGRGRRLALRAVVLQEVAVGALALRHGRRLQAAPRALAAVEFAQGELLDQIEYTVSQSVNYTGKAVEVC